jgi:hypothetical protein
MQGSVAVTLYACVRKVLDSNLGQDTTIFYEVYRGFPQSLHANTGIIALLMLRSRPSKSTTIQCLLVPVTIPFDVM